MLGHLHLTDFSEGSRGIWYKVNMSGCGEQITVTCTGKTTGEWVYVLANGKTTRVKRHNLYREN